MLVGDRPKPLRDEVERLVPGDAFEGIGLALRAGDGQDDPDDGSTLVVLEPPAEESTRDRMIGIAKDAHDLAVFDLAIMPPQTSGQSLGQTDFAPL